MPNNAEHCEDSLKRYGKSFSELHTWMDEPSAILAGSHRKYRHDPNTTPREAKAIFGENADHACLDHIRLDELERRRKGIGRSTTVTNGQSGNALDNFLASVSCLIILISLGLGIFNHEGIGFSIACFAIAFFFFLVFVRSITPSTRKEIVTENKEPAMVSRQVIRCSKCGANYFLLQHEKCPFCGEPRAK